MLQVIKHMDQIPKTPPQPIELPHDERITGLQGLQAIEQGRVLRRRPGDPFVLEHGPVAGLLHGRELQGGFRSSVATRA